jgi:hypothetical protein
MIRRLVCALFLALAAPAGAALADGGNGPGVLLGGDGIAGADGAVRYVTVPAGRNTLLEAVRTRDGRVLRWRELKGGWGIPAVAYDGSVGGLARDNRVLVLAQQSFVMPLRRRTTFQVVDPKTFGYETITLRGDYAYDALSPDGGRLYLIRHTSASNFNRYVVRAYDLGADRLLAGTIADRTQRGWVMEGIPMARTTSANGRFVYTLYQNVGGYPFVHALDTARGTAHCIGLPWTGDQSLISSIKLTVRDGTLALAVPWPAGKRPATLPSFRIDTSSYRVLSDFAKRRPVSSNPSRR